MSKRRIHTIFVDSVDFDPEIGFDEPQVSYLDIELPRIVAEQLISGIQKRLSDSPPLSNVVRIRLGGKFVIL